MMVTLLILESARRRDQRHRRSCPRRAHPRLRSSGTPRSPSSRASLTPAGMRVGARAGSVGARGRACVCARPGARPSAEGVCVLARWVLGPGERRREPDSARPAGSGGTCAAAATASRPLRAAVVLRRAPGRAGGRRGGCERLVGWVLKMKKFNFRKNLDGLTASSPGSGSSSGSNSGGTGSGPLHPGGTAGVLREEIQETLTSEYFQICKLQSYWLMPITSKVDLLPPACCPLHQTSTDTTKTVLQIPRCLFLYFY
ncbi:uncharacterized protein LOC134470346 [Cavia porcellus]|uniref:uncharacterized protein LOC134470346 n=1 Tax=Cavia porcellus TaxID=10141 RepID=UPI002FE144B0